MLKSRTLTVTIDRPPKTVAAYVANPENLPKWATAFCRSVRKAAGKWIVETPEGEVSMEFVPPNEFGVLDHRVSPAPDIEILVPMRVVPNGSGSEVMLTLFQYADMPDEKFALDIAWVERDLATLRHELERHAG